jgi:3'-phosphoadenosine 5'-phosphosulfate sulfotransferase (PAPS reductase)/FAD synthetase
MQEELFIEYQDYSDKNVLIGLSGGINSMAVLCWLAQYPEEYKPKTLHLFYAHFVEHSPDTEQFVHEGLEYAKKHFKDVHFKQTNNSVIDFFREQKMIPHPMIAPCTRLLKIMPMAEYAKENNIDIDLVGYVKEEKRRIKNMHAKNPETIKTKGFPIADKENEWCFQIVKKEIGWYPKIYDIKDTKGKRVFPHNNCLPCKNMQTSDFEEVRKYYPEYWQKAIDLSKELQKHWGRSKDTFEETFMTTFGREDWEVGFKKQSCDVCAFD